MAAKKPKFDPSSIRERVKEREKLYRDLLRSAAEFQDRVAEVVDSEHFEFIVGKCDPLTAQLTLVAALGLKGVNCLQSAVQHVPDSFGERKIKHVSAILQSVLPTQSPPNEMKCAKFCKVLSDLRWYTTLETSAMEFLKLLFSSNHYSHH